MIATGKPFSTSVFNQVIRQLVFPPSIMYDQEFAAKPVSIGVAEASAETPSWAWDSRIFRISNLCMAFRKRFVLLKSPRCVNLKTTLLDRPTCSYCQPSRLSRKTIRTHLDCSVCSNFKTTRAHRRTKSSATNDVSRPVGRWNGSSC